MEVVLDLEIHVEVEVELAALLELPAELLLHRRIAQISYVTDHSGKLETVHGRFSSVVIPFVPLRVRHHRSPPDFVQRYLLRRGAPGSRNWNHELDVLRVSDRPLQRLHAAERTSGHREELVHSQVVQQFSLDGNHVFNGNYREIQPVRFPGFRIDRARARGPLAASQSI